jgi:hypothetical protein
MSRLLPHSCSWADRCQLSQALSLPEGDCLSVRERAFLQSFNAFMLPEVFIFY